MDKRLFDRGIARRKARLGADRVERALTAECHRRANRLFARLDVSGEDD